MRNGNNMLMSAVKKTLYISLHLAQNSPEAFFPFSSWLEMECLADCGNVCVALNYLGNYLTFLNSTMNTEKTTILDENLLIACKEI